MIENGNQIRLKRRMAGIPPLAADLIRDALPEVNNVSFEASATAGASPVEVQAPIEQQMPAEVQAPTAVPSVAPASSTKRRLAGPANAPLLVTSAAVPRTEPAEAVGSVAPIVAQSQVQTQHIQSAPVVVAVSALKASTGRRMSGPSTVPVRVSLSAPVEPAVAQSEAPSAQVAGPAATPVVEPAASASWLSRDADAMELGSSHSPAMTAVPSQSTPATTAAKQIVTSANEKNGPKVSSKYTKLALQVGAVLIVAIGAVLGAQWLRSGTAVQEFIGTYNGHASQPMGAPEGVPAWLGWQHFLNMFFMVLIVRTGLQVRWQSKPPAYWTAKQGSFFSPGKQSPKKISLTQWLHQLLDVAWVLNGVLFVLALAFSGYWMRIVPTSWDVFPNMLSVGIQYLSLDWPDENGWIHYNALQVMSYFVTVFIAAPLAIISGLRMSTWWPTKNEKLSKLYPVEVARAIHIPTMIYFVAFTVVHVFLVFFTGALRNLNHMFTSRDVVDFWGIVIFGTSVVVIAGAWFLTGPMFTRPLAGAMGKVSKN